MTQATFAAGCFWGAEAAFCALHGVRSTVVGYMGGPEAGRVEVVQVTYDPAQVSYENLLDAFWEAHDPTAPNLGMEGSVVFFHDAAQEAAARRATRALQRSGRFRAPIVTEIAPASQFYRAPEHHQQYLARQGPGAPGVK